MDSRPGSVVARSLKRACVHDRRFATRQAALEAVMDWIAFYNHRRLHSTLGYLSPMQYEQRWRAAQPIAA
jgi:putative transposase